MTSNSSNTLTLLENISYQNGNTFWSLFELAKFFDYKNIDSFKNVINKAISFATPLLGDNIHEEFKPIFKNDKLHDYKISRYGVLLCAMFAADNKPNVKEVRLALASLAELVFRDVERIEKRYKLTHGEKYMSSVVFNQGLPTEDFGKFKDAGYRGMYNMSLKELKVHKGINNTATIYDFMGISELAANAFRVTQTADKIKYENLTLSTDMMNAATLIGSQVRNMVKENTKLYPEELPLEDKISTVKNKVKKSRKISKIKYTKDSKE